MRRTCDAINEKLGMEEITYQQIEDATGVPTSVIGDMLTQGKEMKFYSFLKVVRFLFPDEQEQQQRMEDYILEANIKGTKRLALEYASIQNLFDLSDKLLEEEVYSKNYTNNRWANLYRIMCDLQNKKVTPDETLKSLRYQKINLTHDMYCLYRIIECIAYHYKYDYRTAFKISKGIYEDIQQIKNDFIRDCYTSRILIMYAVAYLSQDRVKQARHYAEKVINVKMTQRHLANAYHVHGLSSIYEDLDKSIAHFERAKKIFASIGNTEREKDIVNNIAFVKNLRGDDEIFTHDKREIAYHEIRKGDVEKGLEILKNVCKTAFTVYYQGLATKDVNLLWESYKMFLKSGDLFFSNFPKRALLDYGENEHAVNTAYESHIDNTIIEEEKR